MDSVSQRRTGLFGHRFARDAMGMGRISMAGFFVLAVAARKLSRLDVRA